MYLLDQIFFSNPVVLESICYRTRAKRLINDSKTTGELRKIWTGYLNILTIYRVHAFTKQPLHYLYSHGHPQDSIKPVLIAKNVYFKYVCENILSHDGQRKTIILSIQIILRTYSTKKIWPTHSSPVWTFETAALVSSFVQRLLLNVVAFLLRPSIGWTQIKCSLKKGLAFRFNSQKAVRQTDRQTDRQDRQTERLFLPCLLNGYTY